MNLINYSEEILLKLIHNLINDFGDTCKVLQQFSNDIVYHQFVVNFYIPTKFLDIIKYILEFKYKVKIKKIIQRKTSSNNYIIDIYLLNNTEIEVIENIYKEIYLYSSYNKDIHDINKIIVDIYLSGQFKNNTSSFTISYTKYKLNYIFTTFIDEQFEIVKMIFKYLVEYTVNRYIKNMHISRTENEIKIVFNFYNKIDIKNIKYYLDLYQNTYIN